jgi:ABC-type oligopeptide transport system substrate-binding subunit
MKKIFLLAFLSSILLLSTSACVSVRHDKGKHKGWFKNSNNPHHPRTTNPGQTKHKKNNAPIGKPRGKGGVSK